MTLRNPGFWILGVKILKHKTVILLFQYFYQGKLNIRLKSLLIPTCHMLIVIIRWRLYDRIKYE